MTTTTAIQDVPTWLDECETASVHPKVVEDRLRRSGWPAPNAAAAAFAYRQRFNEHVLGYSALLFSTGFAALGVGTASHMLIRGLTSPVNRRALAAWLTLLVCALPFAVWAHLWAARVDRDDPVAVWSGARRTLATVLLWAAGIVGIGRLVIYVGQLIAVLVGAVPMTGQAVLEGTLNVCVVVAIALPVGMWAFDFLHRFDSEDPSAPATHRRRPSR